MKGCKKALSNLNERNLRANFSSIKNGASIVRSDITNCTIPEFWIPKELTEKLDECGLLDGEKDRYRRNLTPEAIETFKNMEEQP